MSGLNSFRALLISLVLLSSVVCRAEANSQASTQVTSETKQLVQIISQLDLMQQELRLVTKEMVSLHSRLDKFEKAQIAALKNIVPSARRNTGPQSVLFDGKDYKSPQLGSNSAEYAMIEFSDYECPYCRRYATQVFPQIKQQYVDSGKMKYVIRDFPLNFHSQAKPAAIAAHCAGEQSKYWEMNEALIKQSSGLNKELYSKLATEINLDIASFNACLDNPKIANRINDDFSYGQEIGVTGTPRFYIGKVEGDHIINVVPLSGAQPLEAFDRVIQRVMSKG